MTVRRHKARILIEVHKGIRTCIREKADKERIDLRTAAWIVAQDLRLYSELGGLSKAIQEATQQLAMLKMVNEQQKRAITSWSTCRKWA